MSWRRVQRLLISPSIPKSLMIVRALVAQRRRRRPYGFMLLPGTTTGMALNRFMLFLSQTSSAAFMESE